MKYVINHQVVLRQAPEGPLKSYIGPFVEFISAQGYALCSIRRHACLVAGFSQWLNKKGVQLRCINFNHTKQYLRYRAQMVKPARSDIAAFKHLIVFLQSEELIPAQKQPPHQLNAVDRCIQAYEEYLREIRNLAKATILNYVPFIQLFLKMHFDNRPVKLAHLCAQDVVRFVQQQAPLLHTKRAKLLTSALRSFLTYARYNGEVVLDLAAAVPVVANWSMPSIPRAISADQVSQLLVSIDRHTAVGRRDYAILLLLARLGLRSSEVVFLTLDDIDWNTGTLSVLGKGSLRNEFPLPLEVGQAIAAYLEDGRPSSTSRRLFLRAKAPICGFQGASGVGSLVRHSLQRAGVHSPTLGAHQFRHGLATEMLRHGASLEEIGDVLGHRHPQTTKIYAKVDLEALRTLALPWPGGVR